MKARDSKGVSSDGDGDGAILVPMVAHSLRAEGFDASEDGTGRGTPLVPVAFALRGREEGAQLEIHGAGDSVGSLRAGSGGSSRDYVAFHNRQDPDVSGQITHPLGAKDNGMGVKVGMQVRRLTPRECERLQGFPDDYTLITVRGKPAADDPRYKALGNSMAVPVMRWIGERIQMVDELCADIQVAA